MNDTNWIPKTRLMPPQTVEKVLPRPHLVSRVKTALLTRRLTLLSAAAGSGKTTLAVQAIQELNTVRVAWLRLSEDDNDVPAFFSALIAAWQQILPQAFPHSHELLNSIAGKTDVSRALLATLINELLATEQSTFILVLDDYHVIHNAAVHRALAYLLEHAPPGLHLLMTTRVDPPLPLARLRSRGQLSEFRLEDMKFDTREIQAYFRELWQVHLTTAENQFIYEHTDGWVASLNLFALMLQPSTQRSESQDFFTRFTGSQRLIYQLLAEEVLSQQSEDIRRFLLETSILSELTPQLCTAVTQQANAPELLKEAYRRNLFLTEAGESAAYRYHDLFTEFLRHQLAEKYPGRLPELHIRAAQAHHDPVEKIRHYLAAQRWEEAAAVLEKEGQTLLAHGHIQGLQRWLNAFPASIVQKSPFLMYLQGTCALQLGDFTRAEQDLQQALNGVIHHRNEEAEGQILLMLANLASAQHDDQKTLFYLQQALAKPLRPHQQVQAHITSAWMHVYAGNLNRKAKNDLIQAVRITQMSADPRAYTILGHQLRAPLLFSQLGVATFERYCREIIQKFGDTPTPASVGALSLLNVILLLKGNVAEAGNLRQRAWKLNRLLGQLVYVTIGLDISELLTHLFQGNFQSFEDYWQERLSFYEQTEGPRQWLVCMLFLRGLQLYLNDRIDEVQQILEQIHQELLPDDLPENIVAAETLNGMLLMHRKQWREAENILQQAMDRMESAPHSLMFANPYSWLAHLYQKRERVKEARAVMEALFSDYRMKDIGGILLREGAISGPLLDLIDHLPEARRIRRMWQRLHSCRPVPIPQSQEVLTPREMEVLRLLAQGARNQDIASSLFITVRTVKAHVSHILAKMGVQTRTQAVSRARELGIL